MMAYLSVIVDSFREAMSSRILWVVLLLITILLLAFVPFHWTSTVGARLGQRDIRDVESLSDRISAGNRNGATPLEKRLWKSLSSETQEALQKLKTEQHPGRIESAKSLLSRDFNQIIEDSKFYEPELWKGVDLGSRLQELLSRGRLDPELARQRNRLALEAALPGCLRSCPEEAMVFWYGKWEATMIPPMPRPAAVSQIDIFIVILLGLVVGFFGIFAAILVTSPIIPSMLSSGSLYLLLSKPISRPLLFLAKFAGGCSFVLINVTYLICGAYFILGIRFAIWKPNLLWAVPIFMFSFAIFYSVSAVTGLIWRSAILSVVMTVLFWGFCAALVSSHGVLELFFVAPHRIVEIEQSQDELFVRRTNGSIQRWNGGTKAFDSIMENEESRQGSFGGPRVRIANMAYDSANKMLVTLQREWSQADVVTGLAANGWVRESPASAPQNANSLFLRQGVPTVVAQRGVFEISLAHREKQLPDINLYGFKISAPAPKDMHRLISEDIGSMPSDTLVAYSPSDDRVFVQRNGKLRVLTFEEEEYRITLKVSPGFSDQFEPSQMAASHETVVVSGLRDDVPVIYFLDPQDGSTRADIIVESEAEIRDLNLSDDGRWLATIFDDESLKVFDLQSECSMVFEQDAISAAAIVGDRLITADGNDRIVSRTMGDWKPKNTRSPKLSFARQLYRYFVHPAYLICPKPGDLQNTMLYAVTGKKTAKIDGPGAPPGGRRVKLNPWQPVYSNSIFILLMLGIGCIYVYRQDF